MDTAENRMKILQSSGRVKSEKNVSEKNSLYSGTKIRFFIAFLIFGLFYLFEQRSLNFMGLTGEKIYKSVCENAKGFDFVLDFPYTLND